MREAELRQTDAGLVPAGEGWFVVNAREVRWRAAEGRSPVSDFDGEQPFAQVGVKLTVIGPGEPMTRYHREAGQEDFIVLSGEAVLVIEGQERPLRAWDFVHCPPGAAHAIIGAGSGPCVVLAIGSRRASGRPGCGRVSGRRPGRGARGERRAGDPRSP